MRGLEHIPWLYDSMMRLLPQINRWRHDLIQQAHGQILEVGCGTGLGLAHYPPVQSLVAIEPCLISLQRARRRTHAVDLINADAMQLPFVSDSFDTVVSSLVFCSVSDAGLGLQEISRVLKPAGQLLMLEHVQAQNQAGRWLLDTIQPAWTLISGGCHPNRDTESLLQECGFRIDAKFYRRRGLMRMLRALPG